MGDSATSQTIMDNEKFAILKYCNVSDGTGESAAKKVDVSGLTPACSEVIIRKAWFSTNGMGVTMFWDATTDVPIWTFPADGSGFIDFKEINGIGLKNNAGAGITGDVMFTTQAHSAGDVYSIILEVEKVGV